MTVPRSVAEVASRHVLSEIESIDRMYLKVYVSQLQRVEGALEFIRGHRGQPIAYRLQAKPSEGLPDSGPV